MDPTTLLFQLTQATDAVRQASVAWDKEGRQVIHDDDIAEASKRVAKLKQQLFQLDEPTLRSRSTLLFFHSVRAFIMRSFGLDSLEWYLAAPLIAALPSVLALVTLALLRVPFGVGLPVFCLTVAILGLVPAWYLYRLDHSTFADRPNQLSGWVQKRKAALAGVRSDHDREQAQLSRWRLLRDLRLQYEGAASEVSRLEKLLTSCPPLRTPPAAAVPKPQWLPPQPISAPPVLVEPARASTPTLVRCVCHHCQSVMDVDAHFAGARTTCPTCQMPIAVPRLVPGQPHRPRQEPTKAPSASGFLVKLGAVACVGVVVAVCVVGMDSFRRPSQPADPGQPSPNPAPVIQEKDRVQQPIYVPQPIQPVGSDRPAGPGWNDRQPRQPVECPDCKGSGLSSSVCSSCRGTGLDNGGNQACFVCKGRRFNSCIRCGGRGKGGYFNP